MQRADVAEERGAAAESVAGERPPRFDHGPEERGEQEPPGEQRDRVAPACAVFRHQDVEGEADAGHAGDGDANSVELSAPELDDQDEPGQAEHERDPQPTADPLVEREPRPEGDEQRCEELDQERLADRQPVDGEEVRPLDERQAADSERSDEHELATGDRDRPRPCREHDQHQTRERARGSHLGQALRAEPGVLDHLDDGRVDPEQRRRDRDHRVAGGGGTLHRANVSDGLAWLLTLCCRNPHDPFKTQAYRRPVRATTGSSPGPATTGTRSGGGSGRCAAVPATTESAAPRPTLPVRGVAQPG